MNKPIQNHCKTHLYKLGTAQFLTPVLPAICLCASNLVNNIKVVIYKLKYLVKMLLQMFFSDRSVVEINYLLLK